MAMTWTVTPTAAFVPGVEAYIEVIRTSLRAIADRWAVEIEAWMKTNARWTDRTANARQSLTAIAENVTADMVRITLAHGVSYGIYLELAHRSVWGILLPAMEYFGPRIWADVQELMSA